MSPPAIQRITPECQPQFPCWLWQSCFENSWQYHKTDLRIPEWNIAHPTHWHPDQPTAPTQRPDSVGYKMLPTATPAQSDAPTAPTQRPSKMDALTEAADKAGVYDNTPAQSATPRTDAAVCVKSLTDPSIRSTYSTPVLHNGALVVPADFARTLETELAAKDAELTAHKADLARLYALASQRNGHFPASFENLVSQLAASKEECERLKAIIPVEGESRTQLRRQMKEYRNEAEKERGIADGILARNDQLRAENAKLRAQISTKNTENPT